MNQLSHGQKITIPGSVVRSVSFDKIRQGSLSSRNTKPQQNFKKTQHIQKINQPSSHTTTGLCQRLLSQKLTTNNTNNRNPIVTKTFEQRAILIKKQLQQKQMKQCTFKPKLNKTTNTQRTVQQFVHQQLAYQKNKIDKVNQMRQLIRAKIDKQNIFQPNLMIQNKNQNNKNISGAVYQRLYKQGIKRQQNKQNIIAQSIQKRPNSKQKITTISRKDSQKSIIQNFKGSKKHIHTISNNDLSQYNSSIPQSYKQHTIPNQHQSQSQCQFPSQQILQKYQHSQQHTSRQNSKSHKGVKITKNMDIEVICDKKISQNNKKFQQKQKKQNLKNKQLCIKKIIRQISHILSQIQINTINLNYIQMSLILQKMNFLNQKTNINDRKYSYQIWQMLQGDIYQAIPLVNLIRIIFCLLGCYQQNIIQQYLLLLMPQNIHSNIENTKKLILTQKQSKNIKINFQELTLNRLRLGQYIISQPKQCNYTFRPNISKCTNQLAERYRQRVIQESQQLLNNNNGNDSNGNNNNGYGNKIRDQKLDNPNVKNGNGLDHIDLLYLDQKRKQLKIQMKRQKIQQQRKRLQDQAMVSQKNKYNSSRDNKYRSECNRNNGNSQSRFQHLYQLGKNILRNKKIQTNDNNLISKQCTFHPNINSSQNYIQYQSQQHSQSQNHNISNNSNCISIKNSHVLQKQQNNSKQNSYDNSNNSRPQDKHNPIDEIKDFDKSIFRMYQARRIRQQSNNHNHNHNHDQQHTYRSDRSLLPSSQNITNNQKTKYIQHQQQISSLSQSPILYLNICMQGINDIKIPVFYNDNMKTITHKVKILMGLQNTQDQKLQEILKIQILPSLKEIGLGDDF